MSLKLLFLIVCLVHSHGSSCATVEGKRYEYQSMVDPLTRRSPLDKNFMRFGRSSPATDDTSQFDEPTSTPQGHLVIDKNSFAVFGRTDENDKEIDDFLRTERARQDNFMRFGRGRENFMRFGRGKNDNFMRFGRGRNDNFMRFGRGRNENFMRFGRGRNENFMRFGRGRNENFMRFGKSHIDEVSEDDLVPQRTIRSGGSRSTSNFMRFGRGDADDNSEKVIKRSSRDQAKSNFLRFGRGNNDGGRNFMRFGRGEVDLLTRFNQPIQNKEKDDIVGFVQSEKEVQDAQRAKRSAAHSENEYDVPLFQLFKDFPSDEYDPDQNSVTLPYDLDEEYEGSSRHQEIWNRKKRSLGDEMIKQKSSKTFVDGNSDTDVILTHVAPLHYYPSPLSAGLPNFIVGPEFSLLPSLEVSSTKLKRGKIGNRNFIRLG